MKKTYDQIMAEHPELLVKPSRETLDKFSAALSGTSFFGKKKIKGNQKVYFIRSGYMVKIGIAEFPKERLKALSTGNGNQLELIGSCDGGRQLEKELHNRFAHLRTSGEWFNLTPEILGAIQELING